MNISSYLNSQRKLIDKQLLKYLPKGNKYTKIIARAMKYSVIARSKRIRPVLVLAACEAVGGDPRSAIPVACAIEIIHTFTLIHDDLPAIDNDDYRRGKPTNHKVFGEDIAILSGDMLNTIAFKIISESTNKKISPKMILRTISELSSSLVKVVEGQVADIGFEDKKYTLKDLGYIHLNKTAALIRASVLCGAIIGGGSDNTLNCLGKFGNHLGHAFQIMDDVLDITSTRKSLGKTPKKDVIQRKATYPRLIGLKRSKELARHKIKAAIKALQGLGKSFNILRNIALHMEGREC